MMHGFQPKAPGAFLQQAGAGAKGYATPAALPTKLIYPEHQVVAVCGDCGSAAGMNSFMTAVEENIPIVNVIFNNQAFGWVKHGQGERNIACDFASFDHAKIVQAMGCQAIRGEEPNELAPAMREALNNGKPTVVDVQTSLGETSRKVPSPCVGER